MSIIDNHLGEFAKAIEHFKNDIATLKTGRANPAILDSVVVPAYGANMPINQLASVSVPEARSILIQPWDKSVLKEIEKAILEANIGLNPVNEGDKIRITMPTMTEETRKDIVKVLNKKTEEARIAIRQVRDKIKEEIMAAEENKEFGEDERFRLIELLDKKTVEHNDQIKVINEEKETEIMTI